MNAAENTKVLFILGDLMSSVQILLEVQRYLAGLIAGRLSGVQIMVDLSPEQCRELVAAGGARSDPADGVVSLVTLQVGCIELVGAETPEPGSPEALAEGLAFSRLARAGLERHGPTGDDLARAELTIAAREVYREVRDEQLAHRRERDAEDGRIRALERGGLAALWARLMWSR